MGLGSATKKIQQIADVAEDLYTRVTELRDQIVAMRETLQRTSDTVDRLEGRIDQQAALVEALAEEQGIDVDAVLAEAAIEEAEPAIEEAEGGDGDGNAGAEGLVGEAESGDASNQ